MHYVQWNDTPDPMGCNVVFAEDLPTIREVVNEKPLLLVNASSKSPVSKRAIRNREIRDIQREFHQELTRYYPLNGGRSWSWPALFLKGKHGRMQRTGNIPLTRFVISDR